MRRSHSRWFGFTHVELMVVLAIIALLLALFLPYLSRSRQQAHQVLCASNLRQVYLAAEIWHQDNDRTQRALPPASWRTALWPYVQTTTSTYFCPESGIIDGGNSLSQVAVTSGSSMSYLDPSPSAPPLGPQSYQVVLAPPGPNAGSLTLRVDETPSSVTVTPITKSGSAGYSLVNVLTNQVIQPNLSTGQTVTLSPALDSYGVNLYWNEVRRLRARIYALDYADTVADPDDRWAQFARADGQVSFARHLGRANVLYSDGSVLPVTPREIDPSASTNAASLWRP